MFGVFAINEIVAIDEHRTLCQDFEVLYILKSGDLVGCHHSVNDSLTHSQTTKYRDTEMQQTLSLAHSLLILQQGERFVLCEFFSSSVSPNILHSIFSYLDIMPKIYNNA